MKLDNVADAYPLSPLQSGILFETLFTPQSGVYIEQFSYRLTGELDTDAFKDAWQKLIDRHAVLRSGFFWDGLDKSLQVVRKQLDIPWTALDWRDKTADDQAKQLSELAENERITGFQTEQAPLMRIILIRIDDDSYYLLWTHHHLLLDGWCIPIIVKELMFFYNSLIVGQSAYLPPPRAYRDYIQWVQQQSAQQAADYWQQLLVDFRAPTPILDAVTDEHQKTAGYTHYGCELSASTSHSLEQLARQSRLTLNTVFQGAWAMLLAHYTREQDVVFGATVSGRPPELAGVEEMIGLFINTLPVRVNVNNDGGILAWLEAIQQQQKQQEQYSYSSLAEVQRASEVPNGTALFESLLVFENYPLDQAAIDQDATAGAMAGLQIETLNIFEQTNYALTLAVQPGDVIGLRFYYDCTRVSRQNIERLATHLNNLLEAILENPQNCPASIPLLKPAQAQQLIQEQQNSLQAFPVSDCLHQLFEQQVQKAPDNIALVIPGSGQTLTYKQLNQKANQLAHHLMNLGVGPEVLVALSVQRSQNILIGLLAILKSGGAYLPIDPDYPEQRQRLLINDAQATVLISDNQPSETITQNAIKTVYLDQHQDQISACSDTNPLVESQPSQLAYVIYTSGSTGKPKGVQIEHRNVVRLMTACQPWFDFNQNDRWTLFHSYAFDFSVWEIWGSLLHGGQLIVVPYLSSRTPEDFYQLLIDQQITVLNQTPSAFRQLIQSEQSLSDPGELSLRYVIFGGEALDHRMLAPWFEKHADDYPQLVNMYGITETTVHVTYHPIKQAKTNDPRSLIGIPIPDLQTYILDDQQQVLPTGITGELYIGGAGLARGYLNRPELDAQRFINDPYSNARLYRTGDLARWQRVDDQWQLEYRGRNDDQVKVRGFRIELGEISTLIKAHPAISDNVVLTEVESEDSHRLVAYIVPDIELAGPARQQLQLEQQGELADRNLYALPNGMNIVHNNPGETDFVYEEIFGHRSYLQHGVRLQPGDVVFDVGANIGMFSLFAARECHWDIQLFAFEPVTPVFELLDLNTRLQNLSVNTFNLGLAEADSEQVITYYPNLSILSSRYGDRTEEEQTVRTYTLKQQKESGQGHLSGELLDELFDNRLESQDVLCRFTTLSQIIDEHQVQQIDLLKVDVEKSELNVLQGIREDHWSLIQQLIIEVHDSDDQLKTIHDLLIGHGFQIHVDQEDSLQDTRLYNLYAYRQQRPLAKLCEQPERFNAARLVNSAREHLKTQLPEHMIPSAFVLVDHIPLTKHGKLDQHALQQLDSNIMNRGRDMTLPRHPEEQLLADIWRDTLSAGYTDEQLVSVHDNFFEMGGHSLLATQLMSRIRRIFSVDLPLNQLFEAPTVAGLCQCIESYRRSGSANVSDEQSSEQRNIAVQLPELIADPDNRHQPFPLSEIQQAYWLGRNASFELGNVATHGYLEVDCPELDLLAFERAWQLLVTRHDMLRMVILPNGEQQILTEVPAYQIQTQDLRGHSTEGIQQGIQLIRDELSHQLLSVEEGPLFDIRASLLDEDVVRLHLSVDALWGDAWSMRVLTTELFQLYHNSDCPLPELTVQFRDYVMAEQVWQQSDWYQQSLEYWRNRVKTLPPAPELPLIANPADLEQPRFQRRSHQLSASDWSQLKQQASRAGLTPSGVLLAAFAEILAYWSKQPHFSINLTLFNRLPVHQDINRIIGDFTSLILLAMDNRQTPGAKPSTFIHRAQRIQQQLWQDLDHRYVNGVTVLRELTKHQNQNTNGRQPASMPVVFTSTLTLMEQSSTEQAIDPIGEEVFSITQTPQVWLDHKVSEKNGCLSFEWDSLDALFPKGMLDDMFDAYCRLLDQLSSDDEYWKQTTPISYLPDVQLAQRTGINATEVPVSKQLLHTLAREHSIKQPEQAAVITTERVISYAELDQLSNQISHLLRQSGAQPNTLIAVVIPKGWQQVVAVLGILKSGAAYVPIDPELPEERRNYLLECCQTTLVLTHSAYRQKIQWPESVQVFDVETDGLTQPQTALASVQNSDDLAYVIFTSGSTGQPKGVMIDHRGAVNTIVDINRRFEVSSNDRVLALSALSFDLSVYDIFGLLAAGGCIVIPDADKSREPEHWLALMNDHQVSIWNTVPALMQMLSDYSDRSSVNQALRLVMMSGDWIPLKLPEQIKTLWPNAQPVSLGGATEASIWSIFHSIEQLEPEWKSIPYGRPLDNQSFHVLNDKLQPCPLWVPGQLYIGGAGLAKGYWQDQEKTDQAFITHPQSGERLYKTGDLGRYLPAGHIEFLGREDYQVKVSGYRIELGEIEAQLELHPAVKQAVVSVHGDDQQQRLIAHVLAEQSTQSDYTPEHLDGILLDPTERLEFKLQQHGVRELDQSQNSIYLDRSSENYRADYIKRQSYRTFSADSISFSNFSHLLGHLSAIEIDAPFPKYRYPSASNLYPVQVYISVKSDRIEGLQGGTYYFNQVDNRLVLLHAGEGISGDAYGSVTGFNHGTYEQSGFALFLIAQLDAINPLYGQSSRDFCLLEAGYMSQLLMEMAPQQSLGLCPIGNVDWDACQVGFDLQPGHILLSSLLGGLIHQDQTQRWSLDSSSNNTLTDVLDPFLAKKLPKYMLPSTYLSIDSIPLSANGKVDRNALSASDEQLTSVSHEYVAPHDQLEHDLVQIWQEILEHKQVISVQDDFFDLGGNSLLAIRLITRIQQQFEQRLTLTSILLNTSVEAIAGLLREQILPQQSASLITIQSKGDQPPFFCVPGSGGHALYFYHLARHLGNQQPFYALQPAAVDGISKPLTRIEDMASHYLRCIKQVQPHGPYYLGGHSLGAKVAFEMTQQLLQQGEQVALLAAFDSVPFYTGDEQTDDWDDVKWLTSMIKAAESFAGAAITTTEQDLEPLSTEQQFLYVKQKLEQSHFLPKGADVQQVKALVNVFRANTQANCAYRAKQTVPTPITLFCPAEQSKQEQSATQTAWQALGPVDFFSTEGSHLTMFAEPHVRKLAVQLQHCLSTASRQDD